MGFSWLVGECDRSPQAPCKDAWRGPATLPLVFLSTALPFGFSVNSPSGDINFE